MHGQGEGQHHHQEQGGAGRIDSGIEGRAHHDGDQRRAREGAESVHRHQHPDCGGAEVELPLTDHRDHRDEGKAEEIEDDGHCERSGDEPVAPHLREACPEAVQPRHARFDRAPALPLSRVATLTRRDCVERGAEQVNAGEAEGGEEHAPPARGPMRRVRWRVAESMAAALPMRSTPATSATRVRRTEYSMHQNTPLRLAPAAMCQIESTPAKPRAAEDRRIETHARETEREKVAAFEAFRDHSREPAEQHRGKHAGEQHRGDDERGPAGFQGVQGYREDLQPAHGPAESAGQPQAPKARLLEQADAATRAAWWFAVRQGKPRGCLTAGAAALRTWLG